MDELMRKFFLAGIGFLSLTEERFRKNVEIFIKKGEITEKEGKELIDKFKERYKDMLKDIEKKIDIKFEQFIEKAGIVTKKDLEKLEKRIKSLENELKK